MARITLLAMATVLLSSAPVLAGPIIDFSGTSGGTVSYLAPDCTTSDLCGRNIAIGMVSGVSTSLHTGSHTVLLGFLNFTSGSLVSVNDGVYRFGPGGPNSFRITGTVLDAGILNATLLSGQLLSATVDTTSASGLYLSLASGSDTINQTLVTYFGLTDTAFEFSQASFHIDATTDCGSSCGAGTPFLGTAFSIGVPNAPTAAPEPGTLALLGSGLTAVGIWARRRLHSS